MAGRARSLPVRALPLLGALTLLLSLLTPTAAHAAPTPKPTASSASAVRHYPTGTPDLEVRTIGEDQCAQPAAKRKGAWVCPTMTAQQRAASPARAGAHAFCSAFGCWNYVTTAKAEFTGDGTYGYGSRRLGSTDFFIRLTWSGGNSKSTPFRFESTRGVRSLKMSGERIYFSTRYPQGHPAEGGDTYQVYSAGNVNANTAKSAWAPNGYAHYAGAVAYGGVAHQYEWKDAEFPGTWWTYVNSPKFKRNSSDAYVGYDPPKMGSEWYGSGHDA